MRVECPTCGRRVLQRSAGRYQHRNERGEPCPGAKVSRTPPGQVSSWTRIESYARAGGVLAPLELSRALGCTTQYASNRLLYHARAGRLEQLARGRFALNGDTPGRARALALSRGRPVYRGKTVAAWCRRTGLNYDTVRARLRLGWPVHRAVSEPAHRRWTAPLADAAE